MKTIINTFQKDAYVKDRDEEESKDDKISNVSSFFESKAGINSDINDEPATNAIKVYNIKKRHKKQADKFSELIDDHQSNQSI